MSLPIIPGVTTCIENLPRCGASCCKTMSFNTRNNENFQKGQTVTFTPTYLTDDLRHYYRLHGATVTRQTITITLNNFRITSDGLLLIERTCDNLTSDLRCKAHGTKQKPKICQELNWKTAKQRKGWRLTEGCMFEKAKEET